jgi:hypothetical protein
MFTVNYVKDLQWADAEHTIFSCVVKYKEFNEEHPSGISAIDPYAHIQEIWIKGNAGEYGVIAEYVPPPVYVPPPEPEPIPEPEVTTEPPVAE